MNDRWLDGIDKRWLQLKCVTVCCLLITFLVGCSFHGFSVQVLTKHLSAVRIESADPYDEMSSELARKLKAQGIKVLVAGESPSEVVPRLTLSSRFEYYTFSSMHSTTARIYTLRYKVDFSLVDDGKLVASQRNVVVERDLLLQPNEMFEVTSQVGAVKREMCNQMARKIIQIMILRYESQANSAAQSTVH